MRLFTVNRMPQTTSCFPTLFVRVSRGTPEHELNIFPQVLMTNADSTLSKSSQAVLPLVEGTLHTEMLVPE